MSIQIYALPLDCTLDTQHAQNSLPTQATSRAHHPRGRTMSLVRAAPGPKERSRGGCLCGVWTEMGCEFWDKRGPLMVHRTGKEGSLLLGHRSPVQNAKEPENSKFESGFSF